MQNDFKESPPRLGLQVSDGLAFAFLELFAQCLQCVLSSPPSCSYEFVSYIISKQRLLAESLDQLFTNVGYKQMEIRPHSFVEIAVKQTDVWAKTAPRSYTFNTNFEI